MAWGPSPSQPVDLQLMKDAGINISGFCSPDDLKNVEQAGLACFVSDPAIHAYDWTKLPPPEEIQKAAAGLRDRIAGNPAALGILLTDEPGAAMLPGLAEVAEVLRQQMPKLWPYVNGFPFNAGRGLIGAMTYDDYLRAQVQKIGQPFLSYDQYSVRDDALGDAYFANLEIARRVSLELKVPFWNCVLATVLPGSMEPTEITLSAQVYSALAYGSRGIEYFTYLHPDETSFGPTAVDGFGNRTPVWDALRRLNGEILTLAPVLVKLHSTGVYHYPSGFEPEQTDSQIVESVVVSSVKSSSPPKLVMGEFADDQGRQFLMLVNRSLTSMLDVKFTLVDKTRKLQKMSPFSGQWQGFDAATGETLAPGAGALVAIQ